MSAMTPRNRFLVDQVYAALVDITSTYKRLGRSTVWVSTLDVEATIGKQGCQEVWRALDRLARWKRITRATRHGAGPALWSLNNATVDHGQADADARTVEALWTLPALEAER